MREKQRKLGIQQAQNTLNNYSKGLQFQSSYTWSRLINETQNGSGLENQFSEPYYRTDPVHRNVDRGLAPFDLTQVWRFNSIYRLPQFTSSSGAVAKVLNGWWVSGILSLQSGAPFTPVVSANRSRSGVAGGVANIDRPDLVLGRNGANIVSGTSAGCLGFPAGTPLGIPTHYFDLRFCHSSRGVSGNCGKEHSEGARLCRSGFFSREGYCAGISGREWKATIPSGIFQYSEPGEFRATGPNGVCASTNVEAPLANAGQITSIVGSSRQIQLALKILF